MKKSPGRKERRSLQHKNDRSRGAKRGKLHNNTLQKLQRFIKQGRDADAKTLIIQARRLWKHFGNGTILRLGGTDAVK